MAVIRADREVEGALSEITVLWLSVGLGHPYPPTSWNASARDVYGTPGPYEDAIQNTPLFEENRVEDFKGIDVMRVVRSFDPCLPCGVHMMLGPGRVIEARHSPQLGRYDELSDGGSGAR